MLIAISSQPNNGFSKLTLKEAASQDVHDSIRLCHKHKRHVEGKNGRVEYVEKASFSMEILKHINVGSQSGFQCKVHCSLCEDSR